MGLSPGAWGAPKRGMPTGSEAFLELPAALGFGPAIGPTLKTALCHIRTLVGRRINNGVSFAARFLALFCVLWWGALDRLWLRAAQSVRVCSTTGYITSGLRRPSPQALTLFGRVGFIAFLELPAALGFGPATGPTLKTALCHIRTLVGRRINNGASFAFFALLCVLWWGALDRTYATFVCWWGVG